MDWIVPYKPNKEGNGECIPLWASTSHLRSPTRFFLCAYIINYKLYDKISSISYVDVLSLIGRLKELRSHFRKVVSQPVMVIFNSGESGHGMLSKAHTCSCELELARFTPDYDPNHQLCKINITATTTISHNHHHNHHHHQSQSSSQPPPPPVTIIITTTIISHYNHHNHRHQ